MDFSGNLLLEDDSGSLLLEDGTFLLLEGTATDPEREWYRPSCRPPSVLNSGTLPMPVGNYGKNQKTTKIKWCK